MDDAASEPTEPTPKAPEQVKVKKPANKKVMTVLLCLLLIAASGAGAYFWQQQEVNKLQKSNDEKTKQVENLQKLLQAAEGLTTVDSASAAEEKVTAPSQDQLDNMQAAIETMNTAALEGYMAASVKVILAASEGIGERTPVQAVGDLEYLNDADNPWDFSLPQATLNDYAAGDYAQYFPATAFVGKSADGYVISFTFNNSGKISGIFLSADDALL